MDTQMEKRISPMMSEESIMLARKARMEMWQTGNITVKCPKCGTIPRITTSLKGERLTVSCECGYVFDSEMY